MVCDCVGVPYIAQDILGNLQGRATLRSSSYREGVLLGAAHVQVRSCISWSIYALQCMCGFIWRQASIKALVSECRKAFRYHQLGRTGLHARVLYSFLDPRCKVVVEVAKEVLRFVIFVPSHHMVAAQGAVYEPSVCPFLVCGALFARGLLVRVNIARL